MPRRHTHWEGGPVCRFATKADCKENMTQFWHGHLGYPCVKQFQESSTKRGRMNKVATCTIRVESSGQSFDANLREQIANAPQSWRDDVAAWEHAQEVH